MTARILKVSPEEYHQLPGLSSSTACTLLAKSPLHAWMEHGYYGGKGKKATKAMDNGSVVHNLVLGAGKPFAVLNFDDYRTNAAKDARDAAIADGKTPILGKHHDEAALTAVKILAGLKARGLMLDGLSECAFQWEEASSSGPVQCRGMMDHVITDRGVIIDLKIVANAAPTSVMKSAENFGYAIQAAAYTRALVKLRPELAGKVQFLFAFCEADAPYDMNLCRPDGSFEELGERRWLRAVEKWGACLAADDFPGYGGGAVNYISPPTWALTNEEFAQ